MFFSVGFSVLVSESHSQFYVVVKQFRGGGKENLGSSKSSVFMPPARTTPRQTNSRARAQNKTIQSLLKECEPKPKVQLNVKNRGGNSSENSDGGSGGGWGNGPSSWEENNITPPENRFEFS